MDCVHGHRFGALDNSVEGGVRGWAANRTEQQTLAEPVISPDGKWIAGFYADHQLSTQKFAESIAIIGIDGGRPRKIFPIPLSVSLAAGIRWNPDGSELTYVNRGKNGDDIWGFRIGDGTPNQITHFHGVTLISFDWSPDGKQLVFSRGGQNRDVVLIEDTGQK
jgi:Tol biopolymer transport system component